MARQQQQQQQQPPPRSPRQQQRRTTRGSSVHRGASSATTVAGGSAAAATSASAPSTPTNSRPRLTSLLLAQRRNSSNHNDDVDRRRAAGEPGAVVAATSASVLPYCSPLSSRRYLSSSTAAVAAAATASQQQQQQQQQLPVPPLTLAPLITTTTASSTTRILNGSDHNSTNNTVNVSNNNSNKKGGRYQQQHRSSMMKLLRRKSHSVGRNMHLMDDDDADDGRADVDDHNAAAAAPNITGSRLPHRNSIHRMMHASLSMLDLDGGSRHRDNDHDAADSDNVNSGGAAAAAAATTDSRKDSKKKRRAALVALLRRRRGRREEKEDRDAKQKKKGRHRHHKKKHGSSRSRGGGDTRERKHKKYKQEENHSGTDSSRQPLPGTRDDLDETWNDEDDTEYDNLDDTINTDADPISIDGNALQWILTSIMTQTTSSSNEPPTATTAAGAHAMNDFNDSFLFHYDLDNDDYSSDEEEEDETEVHEDDDIEFDDGDANNKKLPYNGNKKKKKNHAYQLLCPPDLIPKIMTYLGPQRLAVLSQTCRGLHQYICAYPDYTTSTSAQLWKTMCIDYQKWRPGIDADPTTLSSASALLAAGTTHSWKEYYRTHPHVPNDYQTIHDALEGVMCPRSAVKSAGGSSDVDDRDMFPWPRRHSKKKQKTQPDEDAMATVLIDQDVTVLLEPKREYTLDRTMTIQTTKPTIQVSFRTVDSVAAATKLQNGSSNRGTGNNAVIRYFYHPKQPRTTIRRKLETDQPILRIKSGRVSLHNITLLHDAVGIDIWNGNSAIHIQPTVAVPGLEDNQANERENGAFVLEGEEEPRALPELLSNASSSLVNCTDGARNNVNSSSTPWDHYHATLGRGAGNNGREAARTTVHPTMVCLLEGCDVTSQSGRGIVVVDNQHQSNNNDGADEAAASSATAYGYINIHGSYIHDCAATGVYVGGSTNYATIRATDIMMNGLGNDYHRHHPISAMSRSLPPQLRGGVIARGHSGVYIESAGSVLVADSNISYNSASGISVLTMTDQQQPSDRNNLVDVDSDVGQLKVTQTDICLNGTFPSSLLLDGNDNVLEPPAREPQQQQQVEDHQPDAAPINMVDPIMITNMNGMMAADGQQPFANGNNQHILGVSHRQVQEYENQISTTGTPRRRSALFHRHL